MSEYTSCICSYATSIGEADADICLTLLATIGSNLHQEVSAAAKILDALHPILVCHDGDTRAASVGKVGVESDLALCLRSLDGLVLELHIRSDTTLLNHDSVGYETIVGLNYNVAHASEVANIHRRLVRVVTDSKVVSILLPILVTEIGNWNSPAVFGTYLTAITSPCTSITYTFVQPNINNAAANIESK